MNGYANKSYQSEEDLEVAHEPLQSLQQKDEGYIELVLRVLAGMCDGQNAVLQVRYCHHWHGPLLFVSTVKLLNKDQPFCRADVATVEGWPLLKVFF